MPKRPKRADPCPFPGSAQQGAKFGYGMSRVCRKACPIGDYAPVPGKTGAEKLMSANDDRPTLVTRKVFLARLARRLAASAFAMTVLSFLTTAEHSENFVPDLPVAAPVATVQAPLETVKAPKPQRLAAVARPARDERTGRLPDRIVASGQNKQMAKTATSVAANPTMVAGVTLFDACHPICESRDPLLYGRRQTVIAAAAGSDVDMSASNGLDADEAPIPPEDEPAGVVQTVSADARSLTGRGLGMINTGINILTDW